MRLSIVIAAAVAVLLAGAAQASAEIKFAYVDVQRALNECDAGRKAKSEFKAQIQKLEGQLQRQQNEVQTLKDEIEKKGMLMKDDERRSLEDQYGKKVRNLERDYKDSKDELEHKDNEVTAAIVKDLAGVIRKIGERDSYTMVMEKGSILWGAPAIDITDEVIRDYNQSGARIGSLGEQPDLGKAGAETGSSFGETAAKHSTISK